MNKIQENKNTNNLEILQGSFKKTNEIYPTYINFNNPKYIEIDDKYFSSLLITNYYREQNDLLLKSLIDTNINMNISMFYEKKDTYKMIRELTYHIGNTGVDLENKNQNSQDIELVAYTHNDAKYIRKQMQVNNEELYFLYLYITVFAKDKRELEYLLNKVEGIIQSKGMQSRRAYFRQEQALLSALPIMENNEDVKKVTKRNILTSGLISTYPFISSSLFDENGIYIGNNIYNNSLVFIDRYNTDKYKNANISIFGTSGAGKSFYTKLLILRNAILGIKQYIIDPEREYENICKNLGGTFIKIGPTSNTYVNVFDIRKESIEEEEKGYLASKIGKLIGFFNLVFGQMDEEEKAILEEKLIECYAQKGITFDDESLYKTDENKITITKIFKTSKDMPLLEDLYNILGKDPKTKKLQIKLLPFIKGSLKFFNEYTNVELNQNLIVADIYELRRRKYKICNVFICRFILGRYKNR
jgi:type IV secretory pathway VirB4 component